MATQTRRGLTSERVVTAAAVIADRDGLATLTLARLAEELRIKPPSLYKHLDGLEAILAALTRRGLAEANTRMQQAAVGKAGDAAILALAEAYWQFARDQPGLYAASLRPIASGDREAAANAEAMLGTLAAVLAGFGVKGDDARHAMRGLRAIIHGFVSLDATGAFRLRSDLPESLRRLLSAFSASLAFRP